MLKRIGAEESGEFKAVASGTLPCGKPVIVNADGTVSTVSQSSSSAGTVVQFESGTTSYMDSAYDTTNNKVVMVYRDNSNGNYGTAVVGTVSGTSISFGTPVVFSSRNAEHTNISFDENAGKVAVFYRDTGGTSDGKANVGTVSGTSISFGSQATLLSDPITGIESAYDSTAQKIVVAYKDNSTDYGAAKVATISGTNVTFGSAANFASAGIANQTGVGYDSTNNKTVIAFRLNSDNKGVAKVATVSGTSISFGSQVEYEAGATEKPQVVFDPVNNKMNIFYTDGNNSDYMTGVIGTVSGTSISFTSPSVIYSAAGTTTLDVVYNTKSGNMVAFIRGSGAVGLVIPITSSSSSFTVGSTTTVTTAATSTCNASYAPDQEKVVVSFSDGDDSSRGKAAVYSDGASSITSENYIGMSRGVAFQTGSAAAVGTAVQYESGDSVYNAVAYDTNVDRVVIAYQDSGNSDHGTAIVGTVDSSDNSISFGTAVVFESAASTRQCIAYDANAQKVVIAYQDQGNSSYGTAIVGTVDSSDNSISFGTAVVFRSASTIPYSVTFDASNNKVVVGYRDSDTKGYAIVGTVSGTSISFGSATKFNDASTIQAMSAYDANAQKVVFAYSDYGSSGAGTAIVGTISGTSISFGSAAVFESGTASQIGIGYDSDSQKVVIAYKDEGDSNHGKSVVGTVSGTSISFGSIVVFNQANTEYSNVVYDTNVDKIIITYQDLGNSNYASAIVGTVSGTDISFGSETVLNAATSSYIGSIYDPDQKRVVTAVRDQGSSSGKAIIFKPSDIATTRGEVADGGNASMDIIGSVSDNQIGLTAGQQYFVQTDGTIGETAGSPSVLAGTAISATELVVKT